MKKSRTRQRSHRASTPSVICLPPPKPPIAAPKREPEVERAMKLSGSFEPLVTVKSSATRQARRKARRAEARSVKRAGKAVALPAPVAVPPVPAQATPAASSDALLAEAPLPRSQALVMPAAGLLARVDAWFARLIARAVPARTPAVSQEALAEQMLALRTELALVQGRLDRMIKAVSSR